MPWRLDLVYLNSTNMLHLLPSYQKRKVIREYRVRLTTISILMFVMIGVSLVVFMLPTYILLHTQKYTLENQKKSYLEIIEKENILKGKVGFDVSGSVFSLTPYINTLSPLMYIDAINKASTNIVVDGYSFIQTKTTEPVSVTISGIAKKRDELSFFSKSLNDVFGNVKLPLASLAKQSDIPFEFKFLMDYQKVDNFLKATDTTL